MRLLGTRLACPWLHFHVIPEPKIVRIIILVNGSDLGRLSHPRVMKVHSRNYTDTKNDCILYIHFNVVNYAWSYIHMYLLCEFRQYEEISFATQALPSNRRARDIMVF